MGPIYSRNQNQEEMNENFENSPQENITTENYKLISSKNKTIQDFPENENYAKKNFIEDTPTQSFTEKDCSFINKKRIRDRQSVNLNEIYASSFLKQINSQNKIEQKEQKEEEEIILREIEEEKQKLNELLMKLESIRNKFKIEVDKTFKNISKKLNKNELKNEIRKIIQTSIRQDNDIKKYETLYNSLNPNSQTTIKAKIKTIEEVLNEETYLKTQILENENNKNKKIDTNKPTDVAVVKENNINLNEAKPEDKKNNNNTEEHKDDINKDIKSKSVKIINHISINDFNNYSFKCLTKNLNFTIKIGTSEAIFKIICENDGEFPWAKNKTILSTDKSKSNIKIQDILMEPLNPRSKCTFDVKFRNLGHLQEGKYYSYLDFKVEGKNMEIVY